MKLGKHGYMRLTTLDKLNGGNSYAARERHEESKQWMNTLLELEEEMLLQVEKLLLKVECWEREH